MDGMVYKFVDVGVYNDVLIKALNCWSKQDIHAPHNDAIIRSQTVRIYESVDEFDKHLPPTVSLLTNERGSKVYVVGAHNFINGTEKDISLVLRNVRPDIVMVQMCYQRPELLTHSREEQERNTWSISFIYVTFMDVMSCLGYISGLAYLIEVDERSYFMQDMGTFSGTEYRHVIEELQLLPKPVLCYGDRLWSTTVQRYWYYLPFWYKVKVVWRSLVQTRPDRHWGEGWFDLRTRDQLYENLKRLSEWRDPAFHQVYVDERALYSSYTLAKAAEIAETLPDNKWKPVTVVGLVSIANLPGIERHWGQVSASTIADISTVPQSGRLYNLVERTVQWGIVGMILYGAYKVSPNTAAFVRSYMPF